MRAWQLHVCLVVLRREEEHPTRVTYGGELFANETVPVTVNGVRVQQSSVLCHGDLLTGDRYYLFLFQDYSSVSVASSPGLAWGRGYS